MKISIWFKCGLRRAKRSYRPHLNPRSAAPNKIEYDTAIKILRRCIQMSATQYNSLFFAYFRDFINWLRNRDNGTDMEVFHVNDDMLGELLHAFYTTFSRDDRMNPGAKLPPTEKNYKQFKARVVLDGGDRSARFEYPSRLLYVTEHGEKRIIITDKMAEIYSSEQNGSYPDLDNCLKRAKEEFFSI